jgi:hypothetical protein
MSDHVGCKNKVRVELNLPEMINQPSKSKAIATFTLLPTFLFQFSTQLQDFSFLFFFVVKLEEIAKRVERLIVSFVAKKVHS